MKTKLVVLNAAFLLALTTILVFSQGGPLSPPGAPAVAMKTLDEVEPRTPLIAGAPGVTTDATYEFIISQPGSYYLTGNIAVAKPHGIQINAEGVTLDLNGFEVARVGGPMGSHGIEIPVTSHRTTVRNGSLEGFGYGLRCLVSGGRARACAFLNLAARSCNTSGITGGEGSVLEYCSADNCTGNSGIFAGAGSTLNNCTATGNSVINALVAGAGSSLTNCAAFGNTGMRAISAINTCSLINCTARSNTVEVGIFTNTGSALLNCTADDNIGTGPFSTGFSIGTGSTVTNCTAYQNTSTATSSPSTGMGFFLGSGCTIQNCTATSNEGDGIQIQSDNVVRENTCHGNGADGDGAGIHSINDDNRIEGNTVSDNDRGIDVDDVGNLIVKNAASGNGADYDIIGGNIVGTISFTPGAGPWGNFSY